MAMHPLRKQRLIIVCFIVILSSIAAALIFFALGRNMNFFYAPTDIQAGDAPMGRTIRVGGLVVPGSVTRDDSGLEVSFLVTDNAETLGIHYQGILPDLFSEGQGVVAVGMLEEGGKFRADQVLAKHDENYMPPEVHESLKEGGTLDAPMMSGDRS